MSANSVSFNPTTTATSESWSEYFSTILVENNTNVAVYVRTDGTAAASDGAGCESVGAGENVELPNGLGLPNPNLASGGATNFECGVDGSQSQSQAVNWTAQQPYQESNVTQVSVIASATATGDVTVTPQ